jgi:hypothetical protein
MLRAMCPRRHGRPRRFLRFATTWFKEAKTAQHQSCLARELDRPMSFNAANSSRYLPDLRQTSCLWASATSSHTSSPSSSTCLSVEERLLQCALPVGGQQQAPMFPLGKHAPLTDWHLKHTRRPLIEGARVFRVWLRRPPSHPVCCSPSID